MDRCCDCENIARCVGVLDKSFSAEGPCDWEPSRFKRSELAELRSELARVKAEREGALCVLDGLLAAVKVAIEQGEVSNPDIFEREISEAERLFPACEAVKEE